jgi:hypothetical protein
LKKISEIKAGSGWELEGVVINVTPELKYWVTCMDCKKSTPNYKGFIVNGENISNTACPVCGAKESKVKGKGLWIQPIQSITLKDDSGTITLDLWRDDVNKYELGDKLHLMNVSARQIKDGTIILTKGAYGALKKTNEEG